ncbi:MAG: hypothetical protein MI919_25445 [Holophagales bacterium]|nr:hypothetical protein [Holophagales bacterium]
MTYSKTEVRHDTPGLPSRVEQEIDELIEQYRDPCLWYLRPGIVPSTREARLRALDRIGRHGDRRAFVRVGELKKWLLPLSNAEFVDS